MTFSEQLQLRNFVSIRKTQFQRIDATEAQLFSIRNSKTKYAENDLITDKPLSEEEIRRLREKATVDQIRMILRRPASDESRVVASLTKIECVKDRIEFVFRAENGVLRFVSKSFDGISLISYIEEMASFRLGCGNVAKANRASVIFEPALNGSSQSKLKSIELVPAGFRLNN